MGDKNKENCKSNNIDYLKETVEILISFISILGTLGFLMCFIYEKSYFIEIGIIDVPIVYSLENMLPVIWNISLTIVSLLLFIWSISNIINKHPNLFIILAITSYIVLFLMFNTVQYKINICIFVLFVLIILFDLICFIRKLINIFKNIDFEKKSIKRLFSDRKQIIAFIMLILFLYGTSFYLAGMWYADTNTRYNICSYNNDDYLIVRCYKEKCIGINLKTIYSTKEFRVIPSDAVIYKACNIGCPIASSIFTSKEQNKRKENFREIYEDKKVQGVHAK